MTVDLLEMKIMWAVFRFLYFPDGPPQTSLNSTYYVSALMCAKTLYCVTQMEMRPVQELLVHLTGWWASQTGNEWAAL